MQARRLEATLPCTRQHCSVDIRGDNRERDGWIGTGDLNVPKYLYCVRFFARCASGRPNLDVASFAFSACGDIGQDACAQDLEDVSLPEEPRDCDVAAFVEDAPLRRIGFQPRPVSRKIAQSQLVHASREPLTDLAADFVESGPVQLEPWQRPLQKGCAIRIWSRACKLNITDGHQT